MPERGRPPGLAFQILGPVVLERAGTQVDLGPAKQRCLLACLLMAPGQAVPAETLIDRMWGEAPPRAARNLLATYVTRLRQTLQAAGCPPEEFRLRHAFGGYVAECDPHVIDVHLSRHLIATARTSTDPQAATELLDEALAGWQPVALAGIPGQWAARVRDGLARERTDALAQWAELALRTGAVDQVIDRLRPLVAHQPAVEELVAPLMTALHRVGSSAQALECYAAARRALAEELGAEPSPRLQALHLQILRRREEPGEDPRALYPAPAQLPAAVPDFVGRTDQLRRLDGLLPGDDDAAPTALVISAIAGAGGIGKTALAVSWAHRVAGRFPDGQLFADLHGFGPGPPTRPVDVLAGFLRALGVSGENIPIELDEAAALYRSQIANRRMLIVLDNVANAEQVRPLLPGTSGCLVLITSRDRLAGLVVTDGARYLPLDVLTEDEALDLLRSTLGRGVVDPQQAAAARLARVCGHLPLALRIAAAHLAGSPQPDIEDYLAELAAAGPLEALSIPEDPDTAVRATFDASYARLTPPQQRMFRLLSLAPGADLSVASTAVLTGTNPHEAKRLLDQLAAVHLVTQSAVGRYAMHDLLREYAEQRACAEDEPADRQRSVERLLTWYLYRAHGATGLLYPNMIRLDLPAEPELPPTGFAGNDEACEWLDAERHNLLAAIHYAARHGPHLMACLLVDAMRSYFWHSRHVVDWWEAAQAGTAVAERDGDPKIRSAMLLSVGAVHNCLGHQQESIEACTRARQLAAQAGWLDGEACCTNNLAAIYADLGHLRLAIQYSDECRELLKRVGNHAGEFTMQVNLAYLLRTTGELREAETRLRQAMATLPGMASLSAAGHAWHNLGVLTRDLGDLATARAHLTRALALNQQASRILEAMTRRDLAAVDYDAGDHERAREMAYAALAVARDVGDRRIEADVLNLLGSINRARGEPGAALDLHQQALRLARAARNWTGEVESLMGAALVHGDTGHPDAAVRAAEQAVSLAGEAGLAMLHDQALTTLAAVELRAGRLGRAREHAERALAGHRVSGNRLGEARALAVLGDIDRAREIFEECGADPRPLETQLA